MTPDINESERKQSEQKNLQNKNKKTFLENK